MKRTKIKAISKKMKSHMKEDKEWRDNVKRRANYNCELCVAMNPGVMYEDDFRLENDKLKDCEAHHLIHRNVQETRFNLDNGMCLCWNHHMLLAHKSPKDFEDTVKKYLPERYEKWQELKRKVNHG